MVHRCESSLHEPLLPTCLPYWLSATKKLQNAKFIELVAAEEEAENIELALLCPPNARAESKSDQNFDVRICSPQILPLNEFSNLHKSANFENDCLDFANRYGFLLSPLDKFVKSHSRFSLELYPEAIDLWKFESRVLYLIKRAARSLRNSRKFGHSKTDREKFVAADLLDQYDGQCDRIPGQLPTYISQLTGLPRAKEDEIFDWDMVVRFTVNYYLEHLSRPEISLRPGEGIILAPRNLLGGLWLRFVLENMFPGMDTRFCKSCQEILDANLSLRVKYCSACSTHAAKKRRGRAKARLKGK